MKIWLPYLQREIINGLRQKTKKKHFYNNER